MKFVLILITGALVALTCYVTDKLGKDVRAKAVLVGVIAVIAGLAAVVYERYDQAASKPSIKVKRKMGTDYLAIGVVPDEKPGLKAIKLSFHLPVRVKEVTSDNRVTEGRSEVVVIGGTAIGYLTNRIDIDIYQTHPGRSMNFLVTFEPVNEVSIEYAGKGLYEIGYIWSHGPNDFHESEWRRIDTNEKVKMPVAEVGVIRFVGNSEDFGLMCTMKIIGKVEEGGKKELIRVISVKKGFSYGVKGVDDLVQTSLPRRTF